MTDPEVGLRTGVHDEPVESIGVGEDATGEYFPQRMEMKTLFGMGLMKEVEEGYGRDVEEEVVDMKKIEKFGEVLCLRWNGLMRRVEESYGREVDVKMTEMWSGEGFCLR